MMDLNYGKAAQALNLIKRLRDKGYVAYFAGGCVRDYLMQKTPDDFDIATSAHPEDVERIFSKTVAVGKQFGVILVIDGDEQFEVATFRSESGYQDGRRPSEVHFTDPAQDAKRRDFTINGLFYDPFEHRVIDYVDGQPDIRSKIIRAIGNPDQRFNEDKLRLLRTIRFASNLDFQIEPETWKALCRRVQEILIVSPERIRDELVKMLTRGNAGRGLDLLAQSGMLKVILPEIDAMRGVDQHPDFHPEGDVFVHTRLMLDKLKNPSTVLALAALLHDLGKPRTYQKRDGHITFYEHAPVGARMSREIMKRLRFSNDEIEQVSACIDNHMKFADVQRMRSGKLKCFVARPTFETELELHLIDCQSSHGMVDNYDFLIKKQKEYAQEELKPRPLINGHDLMAIGIQAGPGMKPLLEELYELQLENHFQTKDEAIQWVRDKYRPKK